MGSRISKLLKRYLNTLSLGQWGQLGDNVQDLSIFELREERSHARALKMQLNKFLFEADARLVLPAVGSNAMQVPHHTDWSNRPEIWRGPITPQGGASVANKTQIGSGAVLFHDCRVSELSYKQVRNTSSEDLAPFGLCLEIFRFDGNFLSLALDMPDTVRAGLSKDFIFRIDCSVDVEKPVKITARLNVKHGPNVEQILRELPLDDAGMSAEFDLAYTNLNEKRVEKVWIDFIFGDPEMNRIVLRDLTFSRRPRANL